MRVGMLSYSLFFVYLYFHKIGSISQFHDNCCDYGFKLTTPIHACAHTVVACTYMYSLALGVLVGVALQQRISHRW